MTSPRILISEIFGPTIQGEGILIGLPTVFVRTAGCDFRCIWCDSLYAVDPKFKSSWTSLSSIEIFNKIQSLSNHKPLMVSLSGGNPAIQPLEDLILLGKKRGYQFSLETQGSIVKNWFKELNILVFSPKPPSSGMKFDDTALKKWIFENVSKTQTIFKFVVFDEKDYLFAKTLSSHYPKIPVYLQPGNHTPPVPNQDISNLDHRGIMNRMSWLVEYTLQDKWYAARVLPQLHVLIWGNKRGV